MKRTTHFSYLMLLGIISLILVLKTNFVDKVEARMGVLPDEITPHYLQMMNFHHSIVQTMPNDSVVFIGDSITQGLSVSAVVPNGVNLGIGGDTTVGVLARIDGYELERAKSIVLAIGVNDIIRRDANDIVKNYGQILNKLPQSKLVIISTVLPIDPSYYKVENASETIKQINGQLKLLSKQYDNVKFLDNTSSLSDSRGYLKSIYHRGDGIHLNKLGYNVWIHNMKETLEGLPLSRI